MWRPPSRRGGPTSRPSAELLALVAVGAHPATGPNEVTGRVGHTGNSTASPHFQPMDAADSLRPKEHPLRI
jgi:hypothetical protein